MVSLALQLVANFYCTRGWRTFNAEALTDFYCARVYGGRGIKCRNAGHLIDVRIARWKVRMEARMLPMGYLKLQNQSKPSSAALLVICQCNSKNIFRAQRS